ncbi:MAG UNVERIFIED_CONTAM: hypothetical protein LVR18_48540 [Planctomycetaceae bacterium]|jgi:hypothetical protein
MVLSPEHPLVDQLTTPDQLQAVQQYRHQASLKSRARANRSGQNRDPECSQAAMPVDAGQRTAGSGVDC